MYVALLAAFVQLIVLVENGKSRSTKRDGMALGIFAPGGRQVPYRYCEIRVERQA